MIDISKLKAISQGTLNTIVENEKKSKFRKDERFWSPTVDEKTGNGSAIIRFLPALTENALPWVMVESFFNKNKSGKYYTETCLRTIGENDPMVEAVTELVHSAESEEEKKYYKKFYPTKRYICNVLVINDPAHPENNGKVKLYRFGSTILTKITDMARVEFEGDTPVNVFDWVNGANFRLRVARNKGDFPTYDSSTFEQPTSLSDSQIETIAGEMHDLGEFTSNLKSYEQLKELTEKWIAGEKGGTSQPSISDHAFSSMASVGAVGGLGVQTPMVQPQKSSGGTDWASDEELQSLVSELDDIGV